jgi:hypothetical protein
MFKKTMATISCIAILAGTISCGTIIYPERRGQPPGGRIDPGIAVLNGLGLLLFVVPGLIAFGVDFATGAIYLPPGKGAGSTPSGEAEAVAIESGGLDWQGIIATVELHSGQTVDLFDPGLRIYQPVRQDLDLGRELISLAAGGGAAPDWQLRQISATGFILDAEGRPLAD